MKAARAVGRRTAVNGQSFLVRALLLASICSPTSMPGQARSQVQQPLGTLTTTVTLTATGKWERTKAFVARDSLSMQATETCTYTVEWSVDNVNLELAYCNTSVGASGDGATEYPAPMKNLSWTYFAERPRDPISKVGLDPSTGMGQFEFLGFQVKAKGPEGVEDGGGLAALAAGMVTQFAALGKKQLPPEVEFSGVPDFYDLFRFKFDPKAKRFSGGNQGSYSAKWQDSDGAVGEGTYKLSYTVSWGATEKKPEMLFRAPADYDVWLPAPMPEYMPGISMEPAPSLFSVEVQIKPLQQGQSPEKDHVSFSLVDVTKHKGRTENYPRGESGEKTDLRFAARQPAGIVVDPEGLTAHTTEEVSEATILVEALDTAACGKLIAETKRLRLRARYVPSNAYSLTIPMDANGNCIADGWERFKDLDSSADEETVSGQDATGDGMNVDQEYRGFVVLEGNKRIFRRMDPKLKELFVIDEGGIFDTSVWGKASRIAAWRLDESLVRGGNDAKQSRIVNFNSESSGEKHALRLETIRGSRDPANPGSNEGEWGYTEEWPIQSPKDVKACRVFKDRIRATLNDLYLWLGKALTVPGSPESKELAGSDFPRWLAQRALNQLGPSQVEALADKLTLLSAIHETGHALGVPGHMNAKGEEDRIGPKECPMRYLNHLNSRQLIILQLLFAPNSPMPGEANRFCTTEFECFRKLNVKD